MDRIYGNESGISYCYDNGGVTFYCSDVYTCRDIDMASNVTLMNWLLTHDKRQSLAKLINYGFLPDSALNELLTYANEHNMPDIAAYTIQQIQKGETPDTKFHI